MENLACDDVQHVPESRDGTMVEPLKDKDWSPDVQKFLKNGDNCVFSCLGSSVVDWVKTPQILAVVSSAKQDNALLSFAHPGFGCEQNNLILNFAVPLNHMVKITIASDDANPFCQDRVVDLICDGMTYKLELDRSEQSETALEIIRNGCSREDVFTGPIDTVWLTKYTIPGRDNSIQGWPWDHVIKPDVTEPTPIAFHADDDILAFDPFAPSTSAVPVSQPREVLRRAPTVDVTEFDDINAPLPDDGHVEQPNPSSGKGGRASLLRRSRDVMSLKRPTSTAATASGVKPDADIETNGVEPASVPMSYDVVDNLDVKRTDDNTTPTPPAVSRQSSLFRGSKARENLVRLRMAARETEFTEVFPFTVFAGTWNVNGQTPSENVSPWLAYDSTPPDIVAVGFQELDLSTEALVFNESSREEVWVGIVTKGLHPDADYKRLRTVRLVGMMLVCFVQTKHLAHVFDVEAETVGTGIMGMMGNKGGVAIRLQIHNSTICFVNSHLAAHLQEYDRRNQDFREISSKLSFQQIQPPISILQHDMVIWIGDLNYRFDELEIEQVKSHIVKQNYSTLFSYDQLNRQMKAKKVFKGYSEGEITFQPTYKYDPGTDKWDSSEKARAPAWCDRILWRGKNMVKLAYRSHPELRLSDHKPVSALFDIGVKIVNREKQKLVSEQVIWKLDREENESLPHVKLGEHEFNFSDVRFMEERVDYLPVANVGQVPVEYKFIPKLDENAICHPWIKVEPAAGFIMPGDAIEIELMISIDKMSVPLLAKTKGRIDDILVLHLVNGKDFFVPINGNHIPSVFGTSLETLVRMYGPINDMPPASLHSMGGTRDRPDGSDTEPLEIPKELWLIIDHLHKHGTKEDGILLQTGVDEDIVSIRTYLDTCHGGPLPGSIFSVGEALLLLLEALPEPVIPHSYHNKCMEACNNYVLCKQVVSQVPTTHLNVFVYLMAFLRELLVYSMENKLDVKVLAAVFGSILLRPKPQDGASTSTTKRALAQAAQRKARFISHFLVNDFKI